jgi:hypothetical protein
MELKPTKIQDGSGCFLLITDQILIPYLKHVIPKQFLPMTHESSVLIIKMTDIPQTTCPWICHWWQFLGETGKSHAHGIASAMNNLRLWKKGVNGPNELIVSKLFVYQNRLVGSTTCF